MVEFCIGDQIAQARNRSQLQTLQEFDRSNYIADIEDFLAHYQKTNISAACGGARKAEILRKKTELAQYLTSRSRR